MSNDVEKLEQKLRIIGYLNELVQKISDAEEVITFNLHFTNETEKFEDFGVYKEVPTGVKKVSLKVEYVE